MITPKRSQESQKPLKSKVNMNDLSLGLSREECLPENIKQARKIAKTQNVFHNGGITTPEQRKFLRHVIFDLMKKYEEAKSAGVCKTPVKHFINIDDDKILDFPNIEKEMTEIMSKIDTMTRNELWDYRTRVRIYENEIYRQMGWDRLEDFEDSENSES